MGKTVRKEVSMDKFVRDVVAGRNASAKEILERALKRKVARRIKETLAS